MAIVLDNSLLSQISGGIGKQVVIKKYKNRTVITVWPTRPKRKKDPGPLKKLYEEDFRKAVKYAQGILADAKLFKAYSKKVKPGQTVYNYAISEYKKKYGIKPDLPVKKRAKK